MQNDSKHVRTIKCRLPGPLEILIIRSAVEPRNIYIYSPGDPKSR